jgi:hypothetical protein
VPNQKALQTIKLLAMETSQKTNPWVSATIFIIFLLLVCVGIRLIIRTESDYQVAYDFTTAMLKDKNAKSFNGQLPSYAGVKDGYSQALNFFMLAFGCTVVIMVLPRLQTFSIGTTGVNVTLQSLQQTVNSLVQQNNNAQTRSTGVGGIKSAQTLQELKGQPLASISLLSGNDDPQKGRWGGNAIAGDRKISADIKESSFKGLFEVTLTVESTNDLNPLTGIVLFHLHPTFDNPDPAIAVTNGKAVLRLKQVYGAFTVGAELDNRKTQLELDLANINNAPSLFKSR